jgi:hypothetical protein
LEAADRKTWIQCKPHLRGGSCLVERPKQRKRDGEMEMCEGEIAVGLDASAQPGDRLDVGIEISARDTGPHHPPVGENVAGREAQRRAASNGHGQGAVARWRPCPVV